MHQPQPGTQPLPGPLPSRRAPRPRGRRWLRLLAALAILLLSGAAAVGGFYVGLASQDVPVWDPLWLRAYRRDPLDTAPPGSGPWVAAYYVHYDRDALRSLEVRSPHVDQVISGAYDVLADGTIRGKGPDILLGITYPHKLLLMFVNEQFSTAVVRAILDDPAAQQRAIAGMVAKVEEYDAAGAQLDFEGVPPEQRPQLSRFVADLAAALHERGRRLSMAVPAKVADNPKHPWSGAFDYAALTQHVDQLYIMAYDEHWRGGPPGPVASLPWVERVLRYAIYVAPTSRLVLGVPGYGYEWGGEKTHAFGSRRMAERMAGKGAAVEWDAVMGENVARYEEAGADYVVWWPDQRSLAAKLDLARRYNLRGVALWRLGFEPPEFWTALAAYRLGDEIEGGDAP